MRATGLLTELSVGPLEAAETARLAEAVSGRPLAEDDADLLQATTGGFPLFVIEAVRRTVDLGGALQPGGDLMAVLRSRLEQSTPAAGKVASLASAVGTDFTLDLLTEASDLDAGVVVTAVDELWHRRIMREFGDGYDFSHDLLREAAYEQVSPPKRWLLHRRVAQALELLHADDTDAVSAQLAEQHARGGRPGPAVAYYQRAAEVAAGRFAYAEAVRLHRRALSVIRGLPPGREPRPAGARRPGRPGRAAQCPARLLRARAGAGSGASVTLADAQGRRDCTAHCAGRAVDHAVRARTNGRGLPDGDPRPGPGRPGRGSERPGTLRGGRVSRQPGAARGGHAITWDSPPGWPPALPR